MAQKLKKNKPLLPSLKIISVILSVLTVASGSYLYIRAPELIKNRAKVIIGRSLAPLGITDIEIGSLNWRWGRLFLRDITSKDASFQPSLTVQEIDVALTPFFNIKAIDIIGPTLYLRQTGKPVFDTGEMKAQIAHCKNFLGSLKAGHLPAIAIRDGLLVNAGAYETVKISVHAITEKTLANSHILTVNWSDQAERSFRGQFILDMGDEGTTLDAYITDINLQEPSFQVRAPEISFWASFPKEQGEECQLEAFVNLEYLKSRQYGILKTPVEINLEAEGTLEECFIDDLTVIDRGKDNPILQAEGTIKPLERFAHIMADFYTGDISTLWDFKPLLVARDGQKASLKGQVTFSGDLIWDQGRLTAFDETADIIMDIRDASLTRDTILMQGINSRIILKSLIPLATQGFQQIKASSISGIGTELTDMHMEFSFPGESQPHINKLTAQALGGKLNAHNFKNHESRPESYKFELDIDSVELADIFRLTDIKTLNGRGTLSGKAALSYSFKKGLEVLQAHMHSVTESGLIQYLPDPSVASENVSPESASRQSTANMAFEVLKNLHFTLLDIHLGQDPHQPSELQATVKLLGYNPEVLNGYPFEFNIVTTGDLKDLVTNTLKNMDPGQHYKRYKKFAEAKKKLK